MGNCLFSQGADDLSPLNESEGGSLPGEPTVTQQVSFKFKVVLVTYFLLVSKYILLYILFCIILTCFFKPPEKSSTCYATSPKNI